MESDLNMKMYRNFLTRQGISNEYLIINNIVSEFALYQKTEKSEGNNYNLTHKVFKHNHLITKYLEIESFINTLTKSATFGKLLWRQLTKIKLFSGRP